jgi:hypothetical protein
MPPPAEAEEEGKNAKDKIMEGLRRDNYYCGRDGRVSKENTFAPSGLWASRGSVPGAYAARVHDIASCGG